MVENGEVIHIPAEIRIVEGEARTWLRTAEDLRARADQIEKFATDQMTRATAMRMEYETSIAIPAASVSISGNEVDSGAASSDTNYLWMV